MNWGVLIPIIAQYGVPLAEKLYQKWASGNPPTQADFDELRGEMNQSAADRLKLAVVNSGLTLDDPKVIELLKLAGG